MKNFEILSRRHFDNWPSWHIVYEWEDEFSLLLKIPIIDVKNKNSFFENKFIRRLFSLKPVKSLFLFANKFAASGKKGIAFELLLKKNFSYTNNINSIPIIIDYWEKETGPFLSTYKNCKLICISSLEVLNHLKQKNFPLNIQHLPLSLPDKYKIDDQTTFKKKYDLIQAGRRNEVLWNFLLEYEKKFPEIEYLYQENIDGTLYYKSNKTGIIGSFHTREQYINLLSECRIGFYSTPGIDSGENRTHGFNPVTPRYLELLASGCLLLGRYPDNDETRFYELEKFCPHVTTYQQFEELLTGYLNSKGPDMQSYSQLLDKHYTSNRAYQLKRYLEQTFKS